MTYSAVGDLLIGDVSLVGVDSERYVVSAFDEMNSRLGYIYELPIVMDAGTAGALTLKKINNFIASGRLILAVASGAEDNSLHAYGQSLLQQGYAELALVLNGSLPLVGADRILADTAVGGPEILSHDSASGVEAFEAEFYWKNSYAYNGRPKYRYDPAIWNPGQ